MSQQLIDISLPLSPSSITYPNNPVVEFESQPTQNNVITKITFGSHSGTHIDAPNHAIAGGKTIDEFPIETFHGGARVIDLSSAKEGISLADLESKEIQKGERILLKTANSSRGYKEFFPDFIYLSPEGAEYLVSREVMLVGIDSLSIKQKGNSDNRAHTLLLEKNIPILEGLDLSNAPEGNYTLACFPLKFIGIDGSPVRAVLRPGTN